MYYRRGLIIDESKGNTRFMAIANDIFYISFWEADSRRLVQQRHALYIQNKYDEAIKAFDKAIELNPKHAIAWNSKGNTLKARISTVSRNTWTDYRSMVF